MKYKKIFKYILSIGIMYTLNVSISFAIENNIVDKSIIKYLNELKDSKFTSIIEVNDGGVVIAGSSADNENFTSAIIAKYNNKGNQEWFKKFGDSGENIFNSVIETKDGGIVVAGQSYSSTEFTNDGGIDAIIVKYDKDGNRQWVKSFGGSNDDYFKSVVETRDDGLVAVGYSYSTDASFISNGFYDTVIVKYNKDGDELWAKNFGGSNDDYFKSVIETKDGGLVAVGYSGSADTDFINKGETDAIIVKYDKDGNQQWVKSFGGSNDDYFKSVVETRDKGMVVTGVWNEDATIVKYDKDGNQQWIKKFNKGITGAFDSVIELRNGDIMTLATTIETPDDIKRYMFLSSLIIYDSNGNELGVKSFSKGVNDRFYSIKETIDGDFVLVGTSKSIDTESMKESSFPILLYYNENYEDIFKQINEIDPSISIEDFNAIRETVNQIPDGIFKEYFKNRLKDLGLDKGFIEELERKTSSANLDIYIKSENVLTMSLDTNSITFEDFSGIEDMEKNNAINITINSSLPYQLNAYLPTEIQNSNKSNTMDKRILNIKDNSESTYQTFTNTTDKVILKDNCSTGNDLVHGIDIKLKGGIAHEKDVYKTTIKFEAEQK